MIDLITESHREWKIEKKSIANVRNIFWDLSTPALCEQIILRHEGVMAQLGPMVVSTGLHTGRSPVDKFVVDEAITRDEIWWGAVNHPMSIDSFDRLYQKQQAYLQDKDIFVQNCYTGAESDYRIPVRIITEAAWQSLVARNLFIQEPDPLKQQELRPEFTVICTPNFRADPKVDGTSSETFIVLNIPKGLVLIGGTSYAGEIKKSIFTLMNYLLPKKDVLPMHCSANYGKDRDDVALFFGLSGTGKTALATTPERTLVGDDEHGWSKRGVFNFEGGCYAKVVHVKEETEPEIYNTTRKFGTILENVKIDLSNRHINLEDTSLTENIRAAYPMGHIPRSDLGGTAGHPRHIIFLTFDAFGIMPPVSRLSHEQAIYHFLSGYTSKVAGAETGIQEPKAVFSPCFASPFLPLAPKVYADLLSKKLNEHDVDCWLLNTGITGGVFGVGTRIPIAASRAIVSSILNGSLMKVKTRTESIFGLEVPIECLGVPKEQLDPRGMWSDLKAYDKKASELLAMFDVNFQKHTELH